jgi:pSer/pThr/pTyr-binding forkhead associated (FHA) protein
VIPDPGNLVCVECLEPLARRAMADPPAYDAVTGTRRDVPRTLMVTFPDGQVTVPAGTTVLLGRAPECGPYAGVFASCDNVSRRHATLGAEPGGAAWVRDEKSINGTYVNGVRAEPGVRTGLRDGDILRFAADVEAQVRLLEPTDD